MIDSAVDWEGIIEASRDKIRPSDAARTLKLEHCRLFRSILEQIHVQALNKQVRRVHSGLGFLDLINRECKVKGTPGCACTSGGSVPDNRESAFCSMGKMPKQQE